MDFGKTSGRAKTGLPVALIAATCLLSASLASPAFAGPLADGARLAEEKAQAGDTKAAYDAAREAFSKFAAGLPFTIGKSIFVSEKPVAFGAYNPRANSVFKPGEPLITYIEVFGLQWKPVGGEKLEANMNVDMELVDSKGATLAVQKTFGRFSYVSYVPNEWFTSLMLDVSGIKPGDYAVRYTVHDVVGQRSAVFEQPFTVAAQ